MNIEGYHHSLSKESLKNLLLTQQPKQVLKVLEDDTENVLQAIKTSLIILQQNPQGNENLFELIEKLISEYRYPICFALEEYHEVLSKISNSGYNKQISAIVSQCVESFNFSEGDKQLPKLSQLFEKFFMISVSNIEAKGSIPAYILYKTALDDYLQNQTKLATLTPQEKSLCQQKIDEVSNKNQKDLNKLEKYLLLQKIEQLKAIASKLWSGKQQNKSEQPKEKQTAQQSSSKKKAQLQSQSPPQQYQVNKKELRLRTSFFLEEDLYQDESTEVEYKGFQFPFESNHLSETLPRTICSFLNRRGGRIYIGVRDQNKTVIGIKLTSAQRDQCKLQLQGCVSNFYPSIMNDEMIRVDFIPIKNREGGLTIPGLFVIKLIVKQGDPSWLYSTEVSEVKCYIRNNGNTVRMKADEIFTKIRKRMQNPEEMVDQKLFDDPKPEDIIDIDSIGNTGLVKQPIAKTIAPRKSSSEEAKSNGKHLIRCQYGIGCMDLWNGKACKYRHFEIEKKFAKDYLRVKKKIPYLPENTIKYFKQHPCQKDDQCDKFKEGICSFYHTGEEVIPANLSYSDFKESKNSPGTKQKGKNK